MEVSYCNDLQVHVHVYHNVQQRQAEYPPPGPILVLNLRQKISVLHWCVTLLILYTCDYPFLNFIYNLTCISTALETESSAGVIILNKKIIKTYAQTHYKNIHT